MLQFTLDPAACRLMGLWLFFPGAVASPFIFWQSFWAGAVFFILWSLVSLWLIPLRCRSLKGSVSLGEIWVDTGILFKTSRRMPTRFVSGTQRIETPLLRWCGCSVVIIYSSGTVILLAGLADATADALLAALEEARL